MPTSGGGDRPATTELLTSSMGRSPGIVELEAEVRRVAPTEFSVLVTGETGTGKELVARALHTASGRHQGPFVAVDCGAIPANLLERELFGHEAGAFTGASGRQEGLFDAARGGTLFLDEVSNLAPEMQAKLLRVIQERRFLRVGGTRPVTADVRIVAATNVELAPTGAPPPRADDGGDAESRRDFRPDLYHRLAEYLLYLPPLRQRKEDIPFLAGRFLSATNEELGKSVEAPTPAALRLLDGYHWPGNVRELRNLVRRAVLRTEDRRPLPARHLDTMAGAGPAPGRGNRDGEGLASLERRYLERGLSLKEMVTRRTEALERVVLAEVLRDTGGNKAEAARVLQVDYKTLLTKVSYYGIAIRRSAA